MELSESQELFNQTKEFPKELPFSYQQVDGIDDAQYVEKRVFSTEDMVFENEQPRTNEDIIGAVKREHENKKWFTSEYWRTKGMPKEQVEFSIGDKFITFYNFNKEENLSDEHIEEAEKVLKDFETRFPKAVNGVKWVLIEDTQRPSLSGSEELYPTNGIAEKQWQAFVIMPKGMDINKEHRVGGISNFGGTIAHELVHFIEDDLKEEWNKNFKWEDFKKEEWESRVNSSGQIRNFNKKTGKMAPGNLYPLQPEQCISDYAKKNIEEDICDSLVAYIYNPEKLKEISPLKFSIIQSFEQKQKIDFKTSAQRLNKSDIQLPKVKPEIIKFFIQE
jgi:hypothetical protein